MGDTVLNYMWVDADAPKTAKDEADFGMCLQNIYEFATANPELNIAIWCSRKTNFKIQQLANKASNIQIRKLSEIKAYQRVQSMCPPDKFWAHMDLARLYILDHVLKEGRFIHALYSDMDIDSKKLNMSEVIQKVQNFGTFVAILVNPEVGAPIIENSFLGFSQSQHGLLVNELIPQTELSFRQGRETDGYNAYQKYFHRLFPQVNRDEPVRGIPAITVHEIPTYRVQHRYATLRGKPAL